MGFTSPKTGRGEPGARVRECMAALFVDDDDDDDDDDDEGMVWRRRAHVEGKCSD